MARSRICPVPAVGLLIVFLVACSVSTHANEGVVFEGRPYELRLYIEDAQAAPVTIEPIGRASAVGPPWVTDRTVYRYGAVEPGQVIVLVVDPTRWNPTELGSAAPALAAFSIDLSSPEVAALVAGAAPSAQPDRLAALAAAEALWRAEGPSAYRFTITLSWFIPPERRGPFTFFVRDGKVAEAWRGKAQLSLDDPEIGQAPHTVPELFAAIRELAGAAKLEVRFDPAYGFPAKLEADVMANAIDDEGGFVVTDFEAVTAAP